MFCRVGFVDSQRSQHTSLMFCCVELIHSLRSQHTSLMCCHVEFVDSVGGSAARAGGITVAGLALGLAVGSAAQSWLRVDIVPIGVSHHYLCMHWLHQHIKYALGR